MIGVRVMVRSLGLKNNLNSNEPFLSRETDLWKKLYKSMIRFHPENTVQLLNSRLIGEIERLEKVHRMATKTPTKLSKLSYDQKQAELDLTSLKKDRR